MPLKKDGYLPEEILWREKAAFSDAVGHSMVDYLKAMRKVFIQTMHLKRDAGNTVMPVHLPENLFGIVKFLRNIIPARAR